MRSKLLHCLPARAQHLAYLLAAGTTAVLAMLLPASATPAQSGANILQEVVKSAPRLPLLSHGGEYWHTDHSRILDEHNREVRIAGVNWSGFETRRGIPGGLTMQDYRTVLRTIKEQGYNTVRLPLSNEMIESPAVPTEIAFTADGQPINSDLQGLNSMQILDKVVFAAGSNGLKIILDNHRSEAGDSAEASGLWFTPEYPEESWIADWSMLARHFHNNATVIGMDLRNEPHNAATTGACWDCGGVRDWHLAAGRAGDAVLHANPKLLIFVEGVDSYAGESDWWGGNLMGVRRSPVHLFLPNHLVYSAHVYGPAEYHQPWFNDATTAASLRQLWRKRWAYVSESGYAPVWIGEFGTPNTDEDARSTQPGSEGQWFSELIRFLHEEPSLQWTYWGINGEDRYGLFDARYGAQPVNVLRAQLLASILPGHLDLNKPTPAPSAGAVEASPVPPSPVTWASVPVSQTIEAPSADTFAAAARIEVEQSLSTYTGKLATPPVTTPVGRSARRDASAQTVLSATPPVKVNSAVASDVQEAIAAAMRSAPSAPASKH